MQTKKLLSTIAMLTSIFATSATYAQGSENQVPNVSESQPQKENTLIAYFEAIEAGDLGRVKESYETVGKANPVEPGLLGRTALGVAAFSGKKEIVRFLVEHGQPKDLNDPGASRGSPLFWAVQREHKDIASDLLARGASVDHLVPGSESILGLAATQDNTVILEILLAAKPNVEVRNGDGFTPLMHAATAGRPESVKRLLDAGASREAIRQMDNKNALQMAQDALANLKTDSRNYADWKERLEKVISLLGNTAQR